MRTPAAQAQPQPCPASRPSRPAPSRTAAPLCVHSRARAPLGGADWDRRLFNTYGHAWLVPAILDPQFKFHEGYQIPQGVEVDAFRKAIETLPLIDNTNLFGLHPNADIAFRTRQTSMVISTMLETQPKAGGGGGGETREEVVLKIVLGLQEKLPVDYKPDAVRESIRKLGGAKPLNICLQQEVDRLQKVISLARTSLASLKLAIAGTIVMSPDLADALDALFMTRVPPVLLPTTTTTHYYHYPLLLPTTTTTHYYYPLLPLPTTTTHHYYPLLLPTTTAHYYCPLPLPTTTTHYYSPSLTYPSGE